MTICTSKNQDAKIENTNAKIKNSKILKSKIWKIKGILGEESADHPILPLPVRGRAQVRRNAIKCKAQNKGNEIKEIICPYTYNVTGNHSESNANIKSEKKQTSRFNSSLYFNFYVYHLFSKKQRISEREVENIGNQNKLHLAAR